MVVALVDPRIVVVVGVVLGTTESVVVVAEAGAALVVLMHCLCQVVAAALGFVGSAAGAEPVVTVGAVRGFPVKLWSQHSLQIATAGAAQGFPLLA